MRTNNSPFYKIGPLLQRSPTPKEIPLDFLKSHFNNSWHTHQGHEIDRHANQSAPNESDITWCGQLTTSLEKKFFSPKPHLPEGNIFESSQARLFHIDNLLWNRSTTPSPTITDLKGLPDGSPKEEDKISPTLHPSSYANSFSLTTLPIGINPLFSRLILIKETTSNDMSNQLK